MYESQYTKVAVVIPFTLDGEPIVTREHAEAAADLCPGFSHSCAEHAVAVLKSAPRLAVTDQMVDNAVMAVLSQSNVLPSERKGALKDPKFREDIRVGLVAALTL